MQQKRNIRLLISLVALVVSNTVLFFLFNSDKQTAVDETIFKVNDLTKIDEVILIRKGKSIELKFDGNSWTVNNQPADRRMIDVLFATLQQVQPKRPVAESLQDSVNATIDKEGVSIELLSSGELQKQFAVGGNMSKTQAYFKDSGAGKSYVMIIPGYRVYASGIFELDEGEWKDKYVFNLNWRNFQSLISKIPDNSKNDFEVSMGKDYYEVKGIASVDTTKLNDFLDAVSLLTVDRYIRNSDTASYNSILKTAPLVDLQVSDVSGKIYSLVLYKNGDGTQIFGVIQGTQLAIFDRKKIVRILKTRSWFQKK